MRIFDYAAGIVAMTAQPSPDAAHRPSRTPRDLHRPPRRRRLLTRAAHAVWTGDVIPDGTYSKTATIADAKALGVPKGAATETFGRNGKLPLEFKIADDRYVHLVEADGAMVVGDEGTATYDPDGNWVTTSESTGCPGCVTTYGWSLEGDRLRLRMLEGTGTGDPVDVLIGRLVTEGEWTQK